MITEKTLLKELKQAKESKISSWVSEVSIKLEKLDMFFSLANKLGLVINNKYISGVPKGMDRDIKLFYKLEDFLEYPKPQKIK